MFFIKIPCKEGGDMKIGDIEADYVLYEPKIELQTISWHGRLISHESDSSRASYCLVSRRRKEKEIKELKASMPDRHQAPRENYTTKARIEQLKYEIELKDIGEHIARFQWYDAAKNI